MSRIVIPNRMARRLWLLGNGLAHAPTGPVDVLGTIRMLGFLQIDTIRNVSRAHNHILWSRNQNFREGMLWPLLEKRLLFEHFTHDASLIPMTFLPMWQRQFRRLGDRAARSGWYDSSLDTDVIDSIRHKIEVEGPLSTHAFDTKIEGPRGMWARPPHKKVLDRLWYAGELATAKRVNFVKYYELAERVFPTGAHISEEAQIAWLCDGALARMGFASPGEVQRFWAATSLAEVRTWACKRNMKEATIEAADGTLRKALVVPDIAQRLAKVPPPCSRLRILNPFDPAIRDRTRLKRLFGFDYRNEMFVPKEKRIWGYYVYPLLHGDRFVGRIELRSNRKAGTIEVTGFWPEHGVRWGPGRQQKLDSELRRFARFAGCPIVNWQVPQAYLKTRA